MRLRWTPLAVGHLQSLNDYLAADSPVAANEMLDRVFSAVETLTRFPELGRTGRVGDTRELVIARTPYVVAYRIRRGQIQVLAVLHGARRWPERL